MARITGLRANNSRNQLRTFPIFGRKLFYWVNFTDELSKPMETEIWQNILIAPEKLTGLPGQDFALKFKNILFAKCLKSSSFEYFQNQFQDNMNTMLRT